MRRQMRSQAANHTQLELRAKLIIAIAAAVIIVLTFRTWVDFNVAHLRGTEADAMTGVGDGYFVIALAVVAITCTGALYFRPKFWAWLLPGTGLSAIGIAAISTYQAATRWHATGFDIHGAYVVGGHATAAVYEVFAVAAVMGVVAAVLASVHYRSLRQGPSESAAPRIVKGTRHDQTNPGAAGRLGPR